MTTSVQKWIVIGVILLNAYSFGANCVERFVNYQSWPKLAEANFGAYHRSQQPYILGFVVAPIVMGLLLQVLLLFDRPLSVPLGIVLTLIGASIAGFVATIMIQIPIHRQLDDHHSPQLVTKLLQTDWIRKVFDLVRLIATIILCWRCLQ